MKTVLQHSPFIVLLMLLNFFWIGGFGDGLLGHPYGDMPDHFWGNNWFSSSLLGGEFPLQTDVTHFPDGGELWHIDPLGGVLRSALFFLPDQIAWNIGIWILLTVSAISMYGLSYWRFQSSVTALVLAQMLSWSAYVSGLIHSGLTEYLGLYWVVALIWSSLSNRWLISGILLGLCGWQAFSYGLMAAVMLCCLCWRNWKGVLTSLVTSLFVVGPALWMGLRSIHSPLAAFEPEHAPGWEYQSLPAVDILGWIRMGDWLHPDTRLMGNPGIVQVHYLGWVLLILCAWSTLRTTEGRAWARRISGFAVLSLGPRLSIAKWMPIGGLIFLPMALLYLPYSPFSMVHHPYRITAFLLPLLLLLAGYSLRSLSTVYQVLLLGLYCAETVVSPTPYPFVRTPIPEDVSVEGSRLDWPLDFSTANRRYLLAQVYHRQPIVPGINSWMSPTIFHSQEVQEWIPLLEDPLRRSQNRDTPPSIHRIRQQRTKQLSISEIGIKWVILHREFLSEKELNSLLPILKKRFGEPLSESESQLLFKVQ